MLDQLLAIFDSLDYEECGWIDVLSADFEGKGCSLELLVKSGVEGAAPERWAVHCLECLDYHLRGRERHCHEYLTLYSAPHVLLARYTEPYAQLFFRGRPSDPVKTAFALQACSHRLAGRFPVSQGRLDGSSSLDQFLEFGIGILTEGPVSMLSQYVEVLHAHGIETNLLPVINPNLKYRDDVRALVLGGSYLVGTHFDALLLRYESS